MKTIMSSFKNLCYLYTDKQSTFWDGSLGLAPLWGHVVPAHVYSFHLWDI